MPPRALAPAPRAMAVSMGGFHRRVAPPARSSAAARAPREGHSGTTAEAPKGDSAKAGAQAATPQE
eukprot:2055797-Alexandrium_andersonii.AAC.1